MSRSIILIAVTATAFSSGGCAAQTAPASEGAGEAAVKHSAPAGLPRYEPNAARERPIVAVLAHHEGVEVTDFVVPHGILATSGVADVIAVSTGAGPVEMFPALSIEADATTRQFDREYPEGADYVIVPAVHRPDAPELVDWIRAQATKGATIVGVCDGVLVLASAGLLEGRRATGHWFSIGRLEKEHPGTEWVRDRRYVADGNVITTTGVAASVPVSLALVEAIAGRSRAEEVAASWDVSDWSTEHDSGAYGLGTGDVLTWVGNKIAFWRNDTFDMPVAEGVDEVTLALYADAWGRTSRSKIRTVASRGGPILTRAGLRLVPDEVLDESELPTRVPRGLVPLEPLSTLSGSLAAIAEAYGQRTASFVALQLEHPWSPDGEGRGR